MYCGYLSDGVTTAEQIGQRCSASMGYNIRKTRGESKHVQEITGLDACPVSRAKPDLLPAVEINVRTIQPVI